jgi:hypothetical protein
MTISTANLIAVALNTFIYYRAPLVDLTARAETLSDGEAAVTLRTTGGEIEEMMCGNPKGVYTVMRSSIRTHERAAFERWLSQTGKNIFPA